MRDGSTVYCDACNEEICGSDIPITCVVENAPTKHEAIVKDVICDFHPGCWCDGDFNIGEIIKNQYEPWLA